MTIAREDIRPVALPSEAVSVPEVGGEVLVRGMDMPQMLEFLAERRRLSVVRDGELQDDAVRRASGALLTRVLHWCVVLDDGRPVYSVAEWGAFGTQHADVAMTLFGRAMVLSGQQTEAEKKT